MQELIAPRVVRFFDRDWVDRGTNAYLQCEIENVTGIPQEALNGDPPGSFSIAERMSWAANRKTTRREDIAYCLLGIFDINMPTMYGKGEKAFHRLQEQLCRQTSDLTLFAWEDKESIESHTNNSHEAWPIIAPNPEAFVLPHGPRDGLHHKPGQTRRGMIKAALFHTNVSDYSLTNTGLRVEGNLPRIWNHQVHGTDFYQGQYYFELGQAYIFGDFEVERYSNGIVLRKYGPGSFLRKNPYLTYVRRDKYHDRVAMAESRFRIYGPPVLAGIADGGRKSCLVDYTLASPRFRLLRLICRGKRLNGAYGMIW